MSRAKDACTTIHYDVGMLIDNRFLLTEFLGSGGMACVYRAREDGTPHQYAVKFLKAEYHNQPYLMKFFNDEADNMRQLAHPNIVRFFRFVQEAEYSYIVMDYVDGFSLSDIIKKMYKEGQEIPIPEVVRIMTQVARALDAMHREGFVHRDIKPSNVLIERQTGQTFLSDLGITTKSNMKIEGAGTIAYMPPEISLTWTADHRADVYSFGIMFFEMLAKRRPYMPSPGMRGAVGENEITRQHLEAPIPDITSFRPDLPAELNQLMRKALAKKPEDRYDSILEFAKDVHHVLNPFLSDDMHDFATISHRQITPPDQPSVAPAETESRSSFFVVVAGLGIAIILVGILISLSALPSNTALGVEATTEVVEQTAESTQPASAETVFVEATENAITETETVLSPTTQSTFTPTLTETNAPTLTQTEAVAESPVPTETDAPTLTQTEAPTFTATEATADDMTVLRGVVANLVDTNDITTSTIDCPVYIEQYDTLEAFSNSADATMQTMAQRITEAGQVVYARCRAESPDAPLAFVDAIQDYIDWENAINDIAIELGGE